MISAAVVWKLFQCLRLPKEVQLGLEGLTLKGLFRSVTIAWNELRKVSSAGLLYPEGLFLTTSKKNYLIGNGIDGYDELTEEIQQRYLPQAKT